MEPALIFQHLGLVFGDHCVYILIDNLSGLMSNLAVFSRWQKAPVDRNRLDDIRIGD
jgi:hypothetical protein